VDELGSVFTSVLVEVVSTISGFSLEVLPLSRDAGFDEMIGSMNLNGQKSGLLFVSAGEADMRTLCSFMIGVSKDEVTKEDIDDTLCELVNMIAGNAKLRLSNTDYKFTLSTPFVIRGKSMSLITKEKVHVISKIFGNEEISIKLIVLY
jgi:CheY-specific phosphatase CheX